MKYTNLINALKCHAKYREGKCHLCDCAKCEYRDTGGMDIVSTCREAADAIESLFESKRYRYENGFMNYREEEASNDAG